MFTVALPFENCSMDFSNFWNTSNCSRVVWSTISRSLTTLLI